MRLTPLLLAKKNLTEAYNNRSISYSLFSPSVILVVAHLVQADLSGIIVGLAFVFGSLDDALFSLAREREKGTLAKLLLSPISRWSITCGRVLSSLLLNILRTTLVLALSIFLKIITLSSDVYLVLALFYVASSLITLLTVTMGLLCSSICSSLRSTVLLTSSLLIVFAILPSFIPEGTPTVYSTYNPFGNGYQAFNEILKSTINPQQAFIWMSVCIIILFAAANIAFRSKIA